MTELVGDRETADPIEAWQAELAAAEKLLPAWFVRRMMGDNWSFALITDGGIAIPISTITAVSQAADGSIWLDVELLENDAFDFWIGKLREQGLGILLAPTSRTTASVNAAHIVAAVEIADT